MDFRDYDHWFEKAFKELTRGIEEKDYHHFNRSMGIQIYSKDHYKFEMKKRRMVPSDYMEALAEQWDKDNPHKAYDKLSPKAMDVIRSCKMGADKYGNIKLGGVAIEALMDLGVIGTTVRDYVPTSLKGGFS